MGKRIPVTIEHRFNGEFHHVTRHSITTARGLHRLTLSALRKDSTWDGWGAIPHISKRDALRLHADQEMDEEWYLWIPGVESPLHIEVYE
jgi:hypothetical protein